MKHFFLSTLAFLSIHIYGQSINPGEDEIYREDEVAKIYLTMSSEDSTALLDDIDIWTDEYLPTGFRFVNSLMDTTLDFEVGIRLRGNTSRDKPKKSLKIKFKEFDGNKFYGYKKFNLKAEVNDPSMVREMLSLQMFRNANVPAARSHFSEVYINGGYIGIYLNVEQLDDEFVDSRFENEDGNLYKCAWGATLEDNGQIYNNDIYEIETNEDENDRSILAHFVDVLNNTSDDNFQEEIEKVFDVQPFIRYLAVEALIGHWDGYSYNQNNFYIYENPEDGLIKFMPYDVDNTFGLDWLGKDWGTRNVLDWPKHGEPRPLAKRILEVDSYFNQYVNELNILLQNYFTEAFLFSEFDNLQIMLDDAVSRDTYFPLSFGFTYQDFQDSYTTALEGYNQLPYGLKPYVTTRIETALLVAGVDEMLNSGFELYPNPSNGQSLMLQTENPYQYISIRDTLGKSIPFTITVMDTRSLKLNLSLPDGMYILVVGGKSRGFIVNR